MTKMEMMHVETAQIQLIDKLDIPNLLTCIYKCRIYVNNGTTGEPPATGSEATEEEGESTTEAPPPPPICNTISYDENLLSCELEFITPATKWESRNAAQSETTKHIYVRVGYSGSTSGPPPSTPPPP